jgi:hypothetical protein
MQARLVEWKAKLVVRHDGGSEQVAPLQYYNSVNATVPLRRLLTLSSLINRC